MSIPNKRNPQSVLDKLEMGECNGPKLDDRGGRQREARRESDGAFQVLRAHRAECQQRANGYPEHYASPMYEAKEVLRR